MVTGFHISQSILRSTSQMETRDPCDEVDDHSQLNDTNITNGDDHPEILCVVCNVKMTPTHQCSDFGKTPVKRKDIDAWLESWRLRMAK